MICNKTLLLLAMSIACIAMASEINQMEGDQKTYDVVRDEYNGVDDDDDYDHDHHHHHRRRHDDRYDGWLKTKIHGHSGKITLGRKKHAITIDFDSIKELDILGREVGKHGRRKHSINSFGKQKFRFKILGSNSTYQGLRVKHVQFYAKISGPGATLLVDLYVFKSSGQVITTNDEILKVKRGSVKFDIQLTNWTFCGPAADEDLCVHDKKIEVGSQIEFVIEVKGRKKGHKKHKKRGKGKKLETFMIGDDGECTLSGEVRVDNRWREMAPLYPAVERRGSKTLFVFRFPKFANTVYYDPVIDIATAATGAGSKTNVNMLMISASLACFIFKLLF